MGCVCLWLAACHDPYDPTPYEPGPKGEPGLLPKVHSKEFRVSERDYFGALNEFYSFAHAAGFERIDFGDCFADILDFVIDEREQMPCLGVYAVKGTPTKAHMTFNILARDLGRLDYNDFLTCRVDIYINTAYNPVLGLAPTFAANVDGKLEEFDRRVAAGFGGAPHSRRKR